MKLASISNFRDVGGYPTRDGRSVCSGRLYRSGYLGELSGKDRNRLDSAGIRIVIDLRGKKDIAREGNVSLPAGARLVHLNAFGDSAAGSSLRYVLMCSDRNTQKAVLGAGRAERLMTGAVVQMALNRTDVFGALLKHLADHRSLPAIIHCSAGKDRTGWASTLVLLALGVQEKYILEHYLLSNECRRAEVAWSLDQLSQYVDGELVRPLLEVRPQYLLAALRAIRKSFGTFDKYIRDALKLDDDGRRRLEANLLS